MNAIYTRMKAIKIGRGKWQADPNGTWRYVAVNLGRGRRPDNLQGPFYTRILGPGKKDPLKKVQSWQLLDGDTLDAAIKSAGTIESALDAKAKGLTVEEADNVDGTNRLSTKIAEFCAEIEAIKAKRTLQAYSNSLAYFAESCKRVNVQDITRKDLLSFQTYLRGQEMSERSVYNNFLNTAVFLKWCGVSPKSLGVKKGDWPEKSEREPEAYTEEEISTMLNAANPEERLLLNCFLCSGLRAGELANLTYGDIDFKHSIWTVQPKDGWNTKTRESQRDVPVAGWLTKKLHARMKTNGRKESDLIFFNGNGGPNLHMLRIVKRVAKRAKLAGRVDDHKFRSTAITVWLRSGNTVPDVMKWVGHAKPETILRYAAKVNLRDAETRKRAESGFAQFANVGD
jgi:integrase